MELLLAWLARARNGALNTLALTMLFSLPGIWIAWSPGTLVAIVCTGAAAAVLYCILAVFDRP